MPKRKKVHGSGSVFQRSDGRWCAKFRVEATGKYKVLYAKTEKEAYEKLQQAQFDQKQGKLATGPQRKLEDYLKQWLEEVKKDNIRTSSYVRYHSLITTHIVPELGRVSLQNLKPEQIQAFYAKKIKAGLSARTVQLIHKVLHDALDNAVKWNLVSRNICDVVTVPRAQRNEIQPLTPDQANKLLASARGHRLEVLLTVALITGMRRGELLALRWENINFDTNTLQVRRTVSNQAGYGFVETEPKTQSGRRSISLPSFVIARLKHHRIQQREQQLKVGKEWEEKDLVFPNRKGGYLSPKILFESFERLLKRAGLPHIRFHDLRHSAATILLSMGVNPKVIQEILGHSNISMTLGTYLHVLPSMQEEAMKKWENVFKEEDTGEKRSDPAQ